MAYTSVKIAANAGSFKSEMKSAAAQMRALTSEYTLAATKAKLFGSETDRLKAKAESLTKKVEVQKTVVKLNAEQHEKLSAKLSDQKNKQAELTGKVEAARRAYEESTEATGKNSEQSKALKEELSKLEEAFKANESAIGKTEDALVNQAAKTNKAKADLVEMEEELKDVNKQLKNHNFDVFANACQTAGEKIEGFGKKLMPVTAGITGIATVAITTASDFDSSMSNVQAISGATGEDMDILRNKAREMGEKTKFSAMEAGDAMSYMAMAGWKTEDMLNSIEGIMTLAAASGEDLALTSDIVTDAMTAFGLQADGTTKVIKDGYEKEVPNAAHFADVLAAASSNANTNVALLGESFKYAAPVAGALGYSAEDTAIALGLMANAGIKASNGGTALRSMLTNLAKPSEEVENAMDYLGISLQNNDGSMKSLMEVMQDLRGSLGQCKMPIEEFQRQLAEIEEQYESGELTESKYNNAVKDLTEKAYGAEGALKAKYAATLAGKTGMSGLLAIVGSSDKDFDKLTNAIYESDGAAQEMADIMQDNLAGQVTILKSQLQELGISMGEQLVPFVREGVGAIQDIVDKFNSMSDSQKQTILKVGLFTATIGPAAIGIGKFAQGISTTIKTGKQLVSGVTGIIAKITAKTAATTAGAAADAAGTAAEAAHAAATTTATATTGGMTVAQTALNAVMNLCPIILIVTLIAGLIAAGIALYKNWDTVKEKLSEFWAKIKEIFNKIKEVISGAFSKAKEAVTNKVNEIKDKILDTPLGKAAEKTFNAVKAATSKIMGAAVDTAKQNLSNMKNAYEENGGGIKGVVAAGMEGIKGAYTSGFTFMDNLTGGKLTELKDSFTDKLKGIKDSVANSKIGQAVQNEFTRVKDNISKLTGAAVDTAKQNLSNMKNAYEENGGGIKGVVAAGWEGIQGTYKSGFTFIDNLTGGKLTELKDSFSDKFSEIKSNVQDKISETKETVESNVEKIKDKGISTFNTLKSKVKTTWNAIKEAIEEPIKKAQKTVSDIINKVKDAFNFEWSLPKLKMPHFQITGGFSLTPPSVPKFSVEWYKTGAIMTKPTIFGANGNTLRCGGEAGAEAILPLEPFYQRLERILDEKLSRLSMNYTIVSGGDSQDVIVERLRAIEDKLEKFKITEILELVPDERRLFKMIRREALKEKEATGNDLRGRM